MAATSLSKFHAPQLALLKEWSEYLTDSLARTVLYWDALRQRGNTFLENTARGEPPVLIFGYDVLIDGRSLDRPCNYALMKIRAPEGVAADPAKRPVVVVDPRAGQGPGVGGFRLDSEIGFALRARHPVYFIGFFPEPVPGQTLVDIGEAESRFLEEVIRRHPGARNKPFVIGNCQAGWAVAALASVRPELIGPVVLVGAPLSYWAGADSQNPMRYNGGLLGGTWPANFLADLGGSTLDGAWLIENFEHLDPASTYWKKPYNLYSHIDTDAKKFLDFERWWGGYYLMTKEEFRETVDNLFVGNRLARGIHLPNGRMVDLKQISSPVVVFASWGDNITPPQQALDWIVDVYGHEDLIVGLGHTIVYLLDQDVGHLGIFVGGRVARKEHRELIAVMDLLDDLPPGLYEMVIEERPKHHAAELAEGDTYTVRFETRTVDDIRALNPDRRAAEPLFSTVQQVSAITERLYESLVGPAVRALGSLVPPKLERAMHPLRMRQYLISDLNPLLLALPYAAALAREHRRPAPEANIFVQYERRVAKTIGSALDFFRDARDCCVEQAVKFAYGPTGLGAFWPPEPLPESTTEALALESAAAAVGAIDDRYERGGFSEAVARLLVIAIRERGAVDRRSLMIVDELNEHRTGLPAISEAQFHSLLAEQAFLVQLDPVHAVGALGKLLPTQADRERACSVVTRIMRLGPEMCDPKAPLAPLVARVLEVEPTWHLPPALTSAGVTS
jgi:pimeloyl-ACP methyl ester carboxylesterase